MLEKKHYKTLNRFISEKYLDETYLQKLKEDFYTQKYVKHLAFSDFLKKEFVAWLKEDIKNGQRDYEELYTHEEGYKKWTGSYISWKYLSELYKFFHSEAFFSYMEFFYESQLSTPISFWYKLENILRTLMRSRGSLIQIYNSWDYLTWHTDGPIDKVAGSYVFFLNENWNKDQWWSLEFWYKNNLHSSEVVCYDSVVPTFNTFVFFKCEKDRSWHRVEWVKYWERKTYHDQLFYKEFL